MIKKFLILICLIILFTISFAEMEIPQPTSQFFVNDFADVITKADEEEIFNISKNLYEKTGNSTQLVVVTIDSLNGYSIEEYANELFNKWGIGDKEKNDGVLILLSVGDRASRIEVGYGLEGILTDSKTGRIQDEYMIPYYKNNQFSKGLVGGTEAVSKVVTKEIELHDKDISGMVAFFVSLAVLLILFFIPVFMKKWYKIVTGKKAQKIYEDEFKHKRKKIYIAEKNKKIKICTECGESKFIRCVRGKYLYSKCKNCKQCYQQTAYVYIASHSNYYYRGGSSSGGYGGGFSGGGGNSGGGGSSRSF